MEWIVLAGVMVDLIIGDPRWLPHPVVIIGKLISAGEKWVRSWANDNYQLRWGGVILTFTVVASTYIFFGGILWLAFRINYWIGIILSIYFMSQALAVNSLVKHARAVAVPLAVGNLVQARKALAMIVGRDTCNLDEKDTIRGVVETVAENTVDGIIAPLFYGFLGGPPLALAYKAINTLDSMVGYRNEKYLYLGWAGARLDDWANFLPARISGMLYLLIAPFTPGGLSGVWKTMKRDARRHPSPNSGIPEAAVAGALKIQLGGVNYYHGQTSNRALMGDKIDDLVIKHIDQGIYLMLGVTGLMCLTALGVAWGL